MREQIIRVRCDVCALDVDPAQRSLTVAIDGRESPIDLCPDHRAAFDAMLAEYGWRPMKKAKAPSDGAKAGAKGKSSQQTPGQGAFPIGGDGTGDGTGDNVIDLSVLRGPMGKNTRQAIREWAHVHGLPAPAKGRIPGATVRAYLQAIQPPQAQTPEQVG